MLPDSHRDAIRASMGRIRLLYAVAFAGVALELGLGLFLYLELRPMGAMPGRSALPWHLGLGLIALAHLFVARYAHRWLTRPESVMARLRAVLAKADLRGDLPPELLTLLAMRASMVADVIAWLILQFVTIYGLVAMVMTGALAPLLGLAALSTAGLVVAAPRATRMEALAEALLRLETRPV